MQVAVAVQVKVDVQVNDYVNRVYELLSRCAALICAVHVACAGFASNACIHAADGTIQEHVHKSSAGVRARRTSFLAREHVTLTDLGV